MPARVIIPPEPIVAPEDISGVQAGDSTVEAMIAAVTGEIDGPGGWLGRCLGPQTIELAIGSWEFCNVYKIPFPPLIEVESIIYVDPDGVETVISDDMYSVSFDGTLWFNSAWSRPALSNEPYPIRITYRAGYSGDEVAAGGTGDVPAQAKQAIILSVQYMRSLNKDDLFLRADEVESVGRKEWTVSDQAGNIIRSAAERLLQGLRVY